MNKAGPGTSCRTILSVSGLVILRLIVLCGVNQVKAQSQWATNSNNIHHKNSGKVGVGTPMPAFKLGVIWNISAAGTLCLQGDCRFT
jgi:hypothetical protein